MSALSSIAQAITKTDIVVQLVIVALVAMSVYVWGNFFNSVRQIKTDAKRVDAFEKRFWSGVMLEDFYQEVSKSLNFSTGKVFEAAMSEWIISQQNQSLGDPSVKDAVRARVDTLMLQAVGKTELDLLSDIGLIGTIASLSPFVGLFGTVWGVMDTFKAIANSATVTLNVIAPGIAEALITTAIGILVAICAVYVYNSINARISKCIQRAQSFRADMFAILSRELDYHKGKGGQ